MLLNMEQIVAATKLDARGIDEALLRSGYKDSCKSVVAYLGMSVAGVFVYEITFKDMHTGNEETGKVYLSYRIALGAEFADMYKLHADF